MKIQAKTVEEFYRACGERESDIRQLADVVSKTLGEQPVLCDGMASITMLGWSLFDYKPKSAKKYAPSMKWPLVALAPQKNYLALYVCSVTDQGQYLAEKYKDSMGKVNTGKSCIRFKRFSDLNQDGLIRLLRESKAIGGFNT